MRDPFPLTVVKLKGRNVQLRAPGDCRHGEAPLIRYGRLVVQGLVADKGSVVPILPRPALTGVIFVTISAPKVTWMTDVKRQNRLVFAEVDMGALFLGRRVICVVNSAEVVLSLGGNYRWDRCAVVEFYAGTAHYIIWGNL